MPRCTLDQELEHPPRHRVVLVQPAEREAGGEQSGDDRADRMEPFVSPCVAQPRRWVGVVAWIVDDERPAQEIRRIPAGHVAVPRRRVVEDQRGRMPFGQIERPTRLQEPRHDLAQRWMSGSQLIAPQVTNTRSNEPGSGIAVGASYRSASTKRVRPASPSSAASASRGRGDCRSARNRGQRPPRIALRQDQAVRGRSGIADAGPGGLRRPRARPPRSGSSRPCPARSESSS